MNNYFSTRFKSLLRTKNPFCDIPIQTFVFMFYYQFIWFLHLLHQSVVDSYIVVHQFSLLLYSQYSQSFTLLLFYPSVTQTAYSSLRTSFKVIRWLKYQQLHVTISNSSKFVSWFRLKFYPFLTGLENLCLNCANKVTECVVRYVGITNVSWTEKWKRVN